MNEVKDYQLDDRKANSDLSQGVSMMNDDPNLFELDPTVFLERVYNEILGNSVNNKGEWVRDVNLPRIMNELGAGTFKHEVSCRFSTHTNFSELSHQDILNLVTWALDAFVDNLEDNWSSWGINPTYGNLMSISERLFAIIYECLLIAQNAGMRKHRERSKNPYLRMPSQQIHEGVI